MEMEPHSKLSEVKQEPDNLPVGSEWTTCDLSSDDTCTEVCNFLKVHYPDEENIMVDYSMGLLRWALCPRGYHQSWHIGVRGKTKKNLVAFISGVPERIRVRDEVVRMAKINFLCVHKKLRSKRLAPVMIKEVTRMVNLQNIWQAFYATPNMLPTPPVTTCQYWMRMLNPKKLINVGFSKLRDGITMSMTTKLYKLPHAPITPGFREMGPLDLYSVTLLLRNYLSQLGVAPYFDELDVQHWLLPREDVVHSYVVESPGTYEITDFCSFYTVPLTIRGNEKNPTVQCAYSYYNVTTQTSLPQLMNDALIVSKQKGFDVFYALDVMHNESFLKECKFVEGHLELHYYLYKWRLTSPLKPSELGLVLW